MKTLFLTSALAVTAIAAPSAVQAQRLSPTVVAVVDTDRVTRECTACISAQGQLRTLLQQVQARSSQLRSSLQTEGAPIQAAVNALAGKQPDAALAARIRAFQTKKDNANRELATRSQTLQSTQAHVNQQIDRRLNPIFTSVMNARGATVMVDKRATLASSASIDVTADVLAALNQQLPSVSVTPLPASPQQPRPQGR